VQEEPANMGAWSYLLLQQGQYGWSVVSRPAAASPATGYAKKHEQEQMAIVEEAFGK
jgi:2-oxoglutarate dehydrogenase E1 component